MAGSATAPAQAPRCSDGADTVTIVANAPRYDAIPLDSPIVATFSCDVEHGAVERAFTRYPTITGTFAWQDRTLTFQPSAGHCQVKPFGYHRWSESGE